MKVVAIGGGTGLPVVLRALRRHLAASDHITAVVTAATTRQLGALRKEYGVIPPGDIRNCLLALARVAPEVSVAALQYRFDGGDAQHPVGNLLLAALDMVATDGLTAIKLAAELLGVDDLSCPPRLSGYTWSPTSRTGGACTASRRFREAARRSSAFASIRPRPRRRPSCWRPCARPT